MAFREELARGVHDQALRKRLVHLDGLVTAALQDGSDAGGLPAGELTWRWLFSLRVRELRLEGADTTDRTFAVTRLRAVTADGTAAAADALFSKLEGLSARYAPAGAIVDEATLRRDLSGTALARSSRYPRAWDVLDRLAGSARRRDPGRPGRRLLGTAPGAARGRPGAGHRHARGCDRVGWPCGYR